jgi:ribose transport system substrate-binding protein
MNPWGTDFFKKPDGSPFRVADVDIFVYCDWCFNQVQLFESLFNRAGGWTGTYDVAFIMERQVSTIEDIVATKSADVILVSPVNEYQIVPAVEAAVDAGIPVFACIQPVYSDKVTNFAGHDYAGRYVPGFGTDSIGLWYVDYVESTGNPVHILELWGDRAHESSNFRHEGLHKGLQDHPLITVTESGDSGYNTDIMGEYVLDALTADPTINAVFQQGGGTSGPIEALRTLGRLNPVGDPDHVIIATNECDTEILAALDQGFVDAFCTNSPLWQVNATVQAVMHSIMIGNDVPKEIWVPMIVIDETNSWSAKQGGGPAAWPRLPHGNWDNWPVLDCTEMGIELPTMEMRKTIAGY